MNDESGNSEDRALDVSGDQKAPENRSWNFVVDRTEPGRDGIGDMTTNTHLRFLSESGKPPYISIQGAHGDWHMAAVSTVETDSSGSRMRYRYIGKTTLNGKERSFVIRFNEEGNRWRCRCNMDHVHSMDPRDHNGYWHGSGG